MKYSEFRDAVKALAEEHRPTHHWCAQISDSAQGREWMAYVDGLNLRSLPNGFVLAKGQTASECLASFRARLLDVSADVIDVADAEATNADA